MGGLRGWVACGDGWPAGMGGLREWVACGNGWPAGEADGQARPGPRHELPFPFP